MGLQDFKTESSSKSKDSNISNSANKPVKKKEEPDEDRLPHFIALEDIERERILTFEFPNAFGMTSRHRNEKVITLIQDKEDFQQFKQKAEEVWGDDIHKFFKKEPLKAKDLANRVIGIGDQSNKVCPVCEEEVEIGHDDYTKAFSRLIHSHHRVDEVVDALDE